MKCSSCFRQFNRKKLEKVESDSGQIINNQKAIAELINAHLIQGQDGAAAATQHVGVGPKSTSIVFLCTIVMKY